MESIYLIVLFIVPGMIVKTIYNTIEKPKRQRVPFYEYLVEVVIDSIIVTLPAILIMKIHNLQLLSYKISDVNFLLRFLLLILLLSCIWYFIKYNAVLVIIYKIINWKKKDDNFKYEDSRTVWEKFIGNKTLLRTWFVISIFRDNNYVVTGMMDSANCPEVEEFEFHLTHTTKCQELLENDPDAFVVVDEFYNINHSLRIKFYDDEKIQKHWHEYFNE